MKIRYVAGRFAMFLLLPVGLSGCQSQDPTAAFPGKLQNFIDVSGAVEALPFTNPGVFPTLGSASYDGVSGLFFSTQSNEDFLLVGDASMVANFQSQVVSGTMGNFTGGAITPSGGPPNPVIAYSGSIDLSQGTIGAFGGNDFLAAFDGTMSGGGVIIDVHGNVVGFFKGTTATAAVADSAFSSFTPFGSINGVPISGIDFAFWVQ